MSHDSLQRPHDDSRITGSWFGLDIGKVELHPAKREILGIDLVRFTSAVMVLGFHLCFWNFFEKARLLYTLLGSTTIGDRWGPVTYFGWIGVEVFFVISGFIIAYSAENATAFTFFRGRFIRLMPSIWLCSVVSLPVAYWVEHQPAVSVAKLFAKSLILYPVGPWIQGVLWTLVVEVAFYTIVFLLIYAKRFNYIDAVASLIGLCSASYWTFQGLMLTSPRFGPLAVWMGQVSWSPYIQLSLLHYGCFFSLGVGLWLQLVKRRIGPTLILAPLFVAGCYFEIVYVNSTKVLATGILQPALVPFMVWAFCVALIIISVVYDRQIATTLNLLGEGAGGRVRWLGRMTYPLYLLHLPVAFLVIYLAPASLGQYTRGAIGLAMVILVAALTTSYFEPWMKNVARHVLDRLNEAFKSARARI